MADRTVLTTTPGGGFAGRGIRNVTLGWRTPAEMYTVAKGLRRETFILFTGGPDVSPYLYGQENRHSATQPERDFVEIACFALARMLSIPVMGICRGHQFLAVANKGTLYQDIGREFKGSHAVQHEITIADTATGLQRLMESCPRGPRMVNSYHHQGVDAMPPNGEAVAWANDGLIEAIEYPFGFSVQWHPEMIPHREFVDYMFDRYVGVNP